jgi:peptidase M23-like protein
MIGLLFRFVLWMVSLVVLVIIFLAGNAHAQPPTYLPWDYGATYRVTQGNNGSWSHFDQYNRYAWDFALPYGTPVRSAAPGIVRRAGWDGLWGIAAVICYGDGTCSRYAHLSAEYVSVGQRVDQATLLGRVGSTGNSSAPHLHYQLDNGSGISLPSRFAEAGIPTTGQAVTSRNRPAPRYPTFTSVEVHSSSTLDVTAGGAVTASVTARYLGPWRIPCGDANLGVVGDRPARFADYREGWWPNSTWRSPDRVAAVGCVGYLDPGEQVRWDLRFHPPADVTDGTYLTGTYAPVHEGRAWSKCRIPISLRVTGAYRAERTGQTYVRNPFTPGEAMEVSVTFRNTGRATWLSDGPNPVHLRGINPQDRRSAFLDLGDPRTVGGGQGVRLLRPVPPGETVTITLPIKVAGTVRPGEYKEYFRLVAENKAWFGSAGIYWPFTVRAPSIEYQPAP